MPAWIASIITSLVGTVVDYLKLWYDQESAKTAEWNAKTTEARLKCSKSADLISAKVRNVSVRMTDTPAEWNKYVEELKANRIARIMMPLLVVVILLSSGCLFTNYVYQESKYPSIDSPARPAVPEQPIQWTEREKILQDYAGTLEARIKEFNRLVEEHNRKNGFVE